ncbi:MAG: SpoIID/LytB domain-containing protein [Bacteroidota bacterium]
MKKIILLILFLSFGIFPRVSLYAQSQISESQQQNISIGIYNGSVISAITFTCVSGEYDLYADNIKLFDIDNNSVIRISLEDDSLAIKKPSYSRKFLAIRIVPKTTSSSFNLMPITYEPNFRTYDDELKISVFYKSLCLINNVAIEKYVPGVVQAEVGTKNPQEFNKVKAIVCRTYSLGNWRRHEDEGFQLCDEVHCQVFKGKSFNSRICAATFETSEYILVDDSAKIITSAFHSNCGGQTARAEDVWSKAVPCLRSINDTFCTKKPNAIWEKKIPKNLWLKYIGAKYNYPITDTQMVKKILNFDQPYRSVYLVNNGYFIPLKFIREDIKLKSTFFTIKEENENMIFKGRGFGHGVGLCQEGAMRMSEKGYSYTMILNYYYTNIHLIRFSQLDFFKTE